MILGTTKTFTLVAEPKEFLLGLKVNVVDWFFGNMEKLALKVELLINFFYGFPFWPILHLFPVTISMERAKKAGTLGWNGVSVFTEPRFTIRAREPIFNEGVSIGAIFNWAVFHSMGFVGGNSKPDLKGLFFKVRSEVISKWPNFKSISTLPHTKATFATTERDFYIIRTIKNGFTELSCGDGDNFYRGFIFKVFNPFVGFWEFVLCVRKNSKIWFFDKSIFGHKDHSGGLYACA